MVEQKFICIWIYLLAHEICNQMRIYWWMSSKVWRKNRNKCSCITMMVSIYLWLDTYEKWIIKYMVPKQDKHANVIQRAEHINYMINLIGSLISNDLPCANCLQLHNRYNYKLNFFSKLEKRLLVPVGNPYLVPDARPVPLGRYYMRR